MSDILFKGDDYVFSYRVAGICIHDGRVLLQKPTNDDGFAYIIQLILKMNIHQRKASLWQKNSLKDEALSLNFTGFHLIR